LHLDSNFEEIPDPKWEISKFYHSSQYGYIGDGFGRELGDLLHLGQFNLYLDPFFEEILNLDMKC
jgi:hypothetical protein